MRAAEREPPSRPEVAVSGESWQPEITNTTEEGAAQVPDLLTPVDRQLQGRRAWLVRADRERDWYAVVDELIDQRAVLVLSPWPKVDNRFAPVFDEDDRETAQPVGELRRVVDEHRGRLGQVPRNIRIGDAFLVRVGGGAEPSVEPGSWEMVIDVTDAARDQAKIAYYGAVGHAGAGGAGNAAGGAVSDTAASAGDEVAPPDAPQQFDDASPVSSPGDQLEVPDEQDVEQAPPGPDAAPPAV